MGVHSSFRIPSTKAEKVLGFMIDLICGVKTITHVREAWSGPWIAVLVHSTEGHTMLRLFRKESPVVGFLHPKHNLPRSYTRTGERDTANAPGSRLTVTNPQVL